jgi:predicted transcriptional regulator
MSKRKIIATVGNLEDMAKEFTTIWHQVESGKPLKNVPIEKIYFEDERLLFKTLTPKRCELLKHIHETGKISVRAIAKELSRDYSNIFQDVKALFRVGLILKDEKSGKYYVPWKAITTEIPLCDEAPKHKHYYKQHRSIEHSAHL